MTSDEARNSSWHGGRDRIPKSTLAFNEAAETRRILSFIFDAKLPARKAATRAGVDLSVVNRIPVLHRRTAHKRALPPQIGVRREGS